MEVPTTQPQPAPAPMQHIHLRPIRLSFTPIRATAWLCTLIGLGLAATAFFLGSAWVVTKLVRIGTMFGW